MKVGIISMQRVPNYGSFLQAYGLRGLLEALGHDVVFIDYRTSKPVVPFRKKALIRYLLLEVPALKMSNDWIKYNILRKRLFDYKYRLKYLKQIGVGYSKDYDTAVDIAVIGSDEVFNCLQEGFNVGFSPMLFGQGINAKEVISYAASFGYTDLDGLITYNVCNKVAQYLKSFKSISVRDENSRYIVETLTGVEPEQNLDPVLIYDFNVPRIDIPLKSFVILYTYKSRPYSNEEKRAIVNFCRIHDKELISIGDAQEWVDTRIEATPLELLAYFKAADFIITDTFHGSIFSIKYNRPFATMVRDNNKQKLYDLLYRLKKEDRIITSFNELDKLYEMPIDYNDTNRIIATEKERTVEYFNKNIK